jgi:metal-responsive CopG/Arc/MetJ family transcriptional regulator
MVRARSTVAISLEKELIQKVDRDRGLIPRSRFIEQMLAGAYAQKKKKKGSVQGEPL